MTRERAVEDLVAVIGVVRTLDVTRDLWLASAVLGGLRQACNDSIRAAHRDRGVAKNTLADVQGCFGELLIASTVERELPGANVTCTPLNWESSGDEADATVELAGHSFIVEAKCHLHEPNKRRFLINRVAAERSEERGARSFVPVLSEMGSGSALLGRPLLMREVLTWRLEDFGYADPARSAWLNDLVPAKFGRNLDEALSAVRKAGRVASGEELEAAASSARARFSELRRHGLELEAGALAAVDALAAVA